MTKLTRMNEAYCRAVAIDRLHPDDAYIRAGYKSAHVKQAVAAIKRRPEVIARIAELEEYGAPPEPAYDLAASGITMDYVVQQYAHIAIAASKNRQFGHAVAAVSKLQEIVQDASGQVDRGKDDAPKIEIAALSRVLEGVANVVTAAQQRDRDGGRLEAVIDADCRDV